MRRLALPLLLALCSLAFAPAPLPKRDRETPAQKRQRGVAEYARKLREFGVEWKVEDGPGWPLLRFTADHPDGRGGMWGAVGMTDDDLARALREALRMVEDFRKTKR